MRERQAAAANLPPFPQNYGKRRMSSAGKNVEYFLKHLTGGTG
jgi:hypothetical protein